MVRSTGHAPDAARNVITTLNGMPCLITAHRMTAVPRRICTCDLLRAFWRATKERLTKRGPRYLQERRKMTRDPSRCAVLFLAHTPTVITARDACASKQACVHAYVRRDTLQT